MDRFDPFVKYADVYGDIINWEKDPMNKPQNQNKYFFSDGKTYYEQICKMLRLMSVFKEAFSQIYSNEDEISEAWDNFVNNLSASVVEGSEPDVTLTWTDDSVNFEFTMVPGVQGDPGVGITSISFNSDYTMTITLSDGNTYTSMSLKGETGPQGPQGETGSGLQILDVYATLADLQSAHPTGQPGDAYQVGSGGSYTLYIWSSSQSAWVPAGSLGTVSPSVSNPLMDGTASAGSLNQYSRGDHVHPSDTSRASKEELDALIKTSQSLIDQSFTYRESPAIQDGMARIDKIKGNTIVWNQLIQNGDFESTDYWRGYSNSSISVSNNEITVTSSNSDWTGITAFPVYFNWKANHKYLFLADVKSDNPTVQIRTYGATTTGITDSSVSSQSFKTIGGFVTYSSDQSQTIDIRTSGPNNISIKNVKCFDLTQMFGSGNEPSTVGEFTSLFQLPYYSYESGKLLSFNGTGIKITGKNLLSYDGENLPYNANGISITREGNIYKVVASNPSGYPFARISTIHYLPKGKYTIMMLGAESSNRGIAWRLIDRNVSPVKIFVNASATVTTFTLNEDVHDVYFEVTIDASKLITGTWYVRFQLNMGTPGDYEPYTSSTLSLPISTYFPTGMKSAVSVYDELTETKAITRIESRAYQSGDESDTSVITDGTNTYYVLETPTETNIDIDLNFNAYEDGTEQLLPVNGSVPSTSPIIADMTYLSIDDAMEYIIEKLANVPQNTQQILDSLEDDVADLQTDVGALQPAVSALQTSVGNINTNIGQISSTVAGHTSSISDMQSDISDLNTGLSDLGDTVTDNTSRIGTLESGLSATNGNVQNLETSVSDLDDTLTAQGTTVTALDDMISDISNNPVFNSLGNHELGFVVASVEATLPANTGTMVTIPKPTIFPNNYTPLFIVGMTTGSYNVSICSIPHTFGTGNSVTCRVWNHGSQQTTQISVYILCMRQRQSQ